MLIHYNSRRTLVANLTLLKITFKFSQILSSGSNGACLVRICVFLARTSHYPPKPRNSHPPKLRKSNRPKVQNCQIYRPLKLRNSQPLKLQNSDPPKLPKTIHQNSENSLSSTKNPKDQPQKVRNSNPPKLRKFPRTQSPKISTRSGQVSCG